MKVQIVVTEEGGWVAFNQAGNCVASDATLSTIMETVEKMEYKIVETINGIANWDK